MRHFNNETKLLGYITVILSVKPDMQVKANTTYTTSAIRTSNWVFIPGDTPERLPLRVRQLVQAHRCKTTNIPR